MFSPRAKGGSPQLFCSDACRKEFHRNGSSFGTLRDKLPGYIDRVVQKQLARPTDEQYLDLLASIATTRHAIGEVAASVVAVREELRGAMEVLGRLIRDQRGDFEAYKQGLL